MLFLAQYQPDASNHATGLGIPGTGFLIGLGILSTLFWIWMLIDCAKNHSPRGNKKMVWFIVILFTHALGSAVYFAVGRGSRKFAVAN